ncbi:Kinesin-like protein KIN-12E [Castilleja foliolosa]|uniref:Kinesin-like protein KIN-12E n=1 Tax=Castilleja foliolosa TaxID=1961234 RepID=A0ABD3CGR6_9LAMI
MNSIREDNKKGIYVENITELEVSSARDGMQQLIQRSNRKVAATNMSRASSRSHSVFTCIIERSKLIIGLLALILWIWQGLKDLRTQCRIPLPVARE